MKSRLSQIFIAGCAILVGSVIFAWTQVVPQPGPPTPIACAYNTSPVTLTNGQAGWAQCDSAGKLQTTATFSPSGTQDINLSQVLGVALSATNPVFTLAVPSASSGAAHVAASSTAAASNLVLKASAGNLYSLTVTIGATSGYVMLFDATSLPANGAVTPVWCAPVTSNGTNGMVAADWNMPKPFATGITAGFSTTGCFTLTASATAAFFGGYK